jgi:hypothetical protein
MESCQVAGVEPKDIREEYATKLRKMIKQNLNSKTRRKKNTSPYFAKPGKKTSYPEIVKSPYF